MISTETLHAVARRLSEDAGLAAALSDRFRALSLTDDYNAWYQEGFSEPFPIGGSGLPGLLPLASYGMLLVAFVVTPHGIALCDGSWVPSGLRVSGMGIGAMAAAHRARTAIPDDRQPSVVIDVAAGAAHLLLSVPAPGARRLALCDTPRAAAFAALNAALNGHAPGSFSVMVGDPRDGFPFPVARFPRGQALVVADLVPYPEDARDAAIETLAQCADRSDPRTPFRIILAAMAAGDASSGTWDVPGLVRWRLSRDVDVAWAAYSPDGARVLGGGSSSDAPAGLIGHVRKLGAAFSGARATRPEVQGADASLCVVDVMVR